MQSWKKQEAIQRQTLENLEDNKNRHASYNRTVATLGSFVCVCVFFQKKKQICFIKEQQLFKRSSFLDQDGAEPSANSVSAFNLLRLSSYSNEHGLRVQCEDLLKTFSNRLSSTPFALPAMVSALPWLWKGYKQVRTKCLNQV